MKNNIKAGLFFIAVGAAFAAETLFEAGVLYRLRPLILIILGSGLIKIFLIRKKRDAVFFGAGSYIVQFGLLSLWLNFRSWGMLHEAWPLFIGMAGVSFLLLYILKPSQRLFLFNGLFLLSVCAVFFLVFLVDSTWWWSIFIFIGLSIIATGGRGDG